MNLLMPGQAQTSSIVPARRVRTAVVISGLLVSTAPGTSAGVTWRGLRRGDSGVMTVAHRTTAGPERVTDEVRSLRDTIKASGVSHQQIARLLGVDRRSLSGWASGEIRPTPARIASLRVLARTVEDIAVEHRGRVDDVLSSRRDATTLLDAVVSGRTSLAGWRLWLSRTAATVSVERRAPAPEPIWAPALRALEAGQLSTPDRAPTVRPESTYEMNPDREAAAFIEPDYQSGRRGYR